MLSDSLHEVLEALWDAIETYHYAEGFKDDLIAGIRHLDYVRARLDSGLSPSNTVAEIRRLRSVTETNTHKRWNSRACGKDYWTTTESKDERADLEAMAAGKEPPTVKEEGDAESEEE